VLDFRKPGCDKKGRGGGHKSSKDELDADQKSQASPPVLELRKRGKDAEKPSLKGEGSAEKKAEGVKGRRGHLGKKEGSKAKEPSKETVPREEKGPEKSQYQKLTDHRETGARLPGSKKQNPVEKGGN